MKITDRETGEVLYDHDYNTCAVEDCATCEKFEA